ncbi:MAG: DUF692 family protein [Nitrospirae bacterium]|nr:DUF692 family protein [Nitrospirota bacterium]
MILTYPVSHSTTQDDYALIPGINALEYKDIRPVFKDGLQRIFHSGIGIIQEGFIDYFDSVADFLNSNNFKLFSFDLGPAAEKVGIQDYYYVAGSEVLSKAEIKRAIRAKLLYVKQRYRGDIAIENLNYFPTPAYEHVCEAEFINEIVMENDVYMVLDIAHAVISAHNLGINKYDYLQKMPFNQIKEIHLSAPGIQDGHWRDLHEVPSADEYELLDFVIKCIPGEPYLVVEYHKDKTEAEKIYGKLHHYYG